MLNKTLLPSIALALALSAPSLAQTTIAGVVVPEEETQLLIDHCRALLTEASGDEYEGATHTDPTNTGSADDSAAFTTDFSEITVSDCRDAGFREPNSSDDDEGNS
ncbi:hypothetical protein [Devosia sp. CAU 1758]